MNKKIMKEGLIKEIDKASREIIDAAKNGKRFILYGDADLDGVSSVIIIKETLEILNKSYKKKNLEVYFPDREKDGYGITTSALKFLKKFSPGLFIALDCGISNFKEIELAKRAGFFVIIVDHHKPLAKLPRADLIVNPHQKTDHVPFKQFSAAGITYKLARYALIENQSLWKPEKFLELVALATLADQMPVIEENKILIDQGLKAFGQTERIGLRALKEITNYIEGDSMDLFQKILAPLNSSDRVRNITETYILLTTKSKRTAKILSKDLFQRSQAKKIRIQEIFEEVEKKIALKDSPIIFEGDKNWPTVMIGVVASRICQKYRKPTFLFKILKEEAVCSARLPKDVDGVKAFDHCKKLLESYGGHPPACGCRLKMRNFKKFEQCLVQYFV